MLARHSPTAPTGRAARPGPTRSRGVRVSSPSGRNSCVTAYVRTPRPVDAYPDANSRSPGNRLEANSAIHDEETIAQEIDAVVGQSDAHGDGQISGTATQLGLRQGYAAGCPASLADAGAATSHHVDTLERIQRAKEDGGGRALRFGH